MATPADIVGISAAALDPGAPIQENFPVSTATASPRLRTPPTPCASSTGGATAVSCATSLDLAATASSAPRTVSQLAREQPALTEGGIRWAIFNSAYNGLEASGALIRVGRRVLIDPGLFLAWMRTNPKLSPPRATTAARVRACRRTGGAR